MNRTLPALFSFALVAVALVFGAPAFADQHAAAAIGLAALSDPATAGLLPLIGLEVARKPFLWGRKRDQSNTFTNVGASQTAYLVIPRNARTLFGMILQLGGTTFTKALISRLELKLGDKSIWGPVTGAQADAISQYVSGQVGGIARSDYHLNLDFTLPNVKETGAEYIGGIDLQTLPPGMLTLEVDIGAATAPTLQPWFVWGAPQAPDPRLGGPVMQKLTRRTYPSAPAGDFYPDVDLRGAIVCREFWFHDVPQSAVLTARGIGGGANSGTGTATVTVTARTPTGRYRLIITAAASNAGTFALYGPDGRLIDTGTVAVAFSSGGLAFTLSDATDFVAGDGFTIDVLPLNTDQNTNLVEVKKNDETWYYRSDRAARKEQADYGRLPLSQLFVVDFLQDNHFDSVLDTLDANSFVHRLNVTSAQVSTLVAQTVQKPIA